MPIIEINIDLQKIDRNRAYKGAKGLWYKAVLIETPNGQYGDYMVKESLTKEEREKNVRSVILGNGKIVGKKPQQQDSGDPSQSRYEQRAQAERPTQQVVDEDVPF